MVRKMAYIGSFWFIGLLAASFLTFPMCFAVSAAAALSAAAAALFLRKDIKYAVCLFSFGAAVLVYGAYGNFVYGNIIKYDGLDVEVKGIITGYADHSGDKASYTIRGTVNGDVKATVTCYADSISADVGDNISIIGKASAFRNDFSFAAENYYKAKTIFLKIDSVKKLNYSKNDKFSLIRVMNSYRERIINVMNSRMDERGQAVMAAMLFGDKSDLESIDKTLMCRAGIGHIMAVSGVHLAVVCTFFGFIISRLPLNKYLRFGIMLVPIFCFVLLAGMSSSVMRSAVMVIIVFGAELFRRKADTFNSLGIAAVILTVGSPFAIRDPSFLLSVSGVFGAGVAAPAVIKSIEQKHRLCSFAKSIILTICVNAVIFPAAVMFFDEFSVISPLSNVLLIPVCELILIGGIIVTVTGGVGFIADIVLFFCGILCDLVVNVSEFIGNIHFLYIPLGNDIVKAAAVTAALIPAAAFAISKRADIGVMLAVCVFSLTITAVNIYRAVPDDGMTVAVLRKNNAVTAVIHNGKSAAVIDLDGRGKAAPTAVKYLNKKGIYRIDALIMNSEPNAAIPVFDTNFKLFDVSGSFIPEEYASFAENDEITVYGSQSGIKLPEYEIIFDGDGNIILNCGGTDIIFYDSGYNGGGKFSAAVRYSGKKADPDADTDILAVMSSGGSAEIRDGQTVYIGESIEFSADRYGSVTANALD